MKTNSLAVLVCAGLAWPALAADVTYSKDIQPLVKKYCGECHSPPDSPTLAEFKKDIEKYKADKVGPRNDTYEDLLKLVTGEEKGILMRRLDDGTNPFAKGKTGNMNKYLGETDEERAANLALFKAWVVGEGAAPWDMNGADQIGDMPPMSAEQLKRIKAKP